MRGGCRRRSWSARRSARTLDLNALSTIGVELVGRLSAIRDGRALFSGGLRNQFALADLKMNRLLDTFDEWARTNARDAEVGPSERFEPTRVPASSRLHLDLASGEIRSIVWATGFRPDYSWLDVPVVDAKGSYATMEEWSMRRGCMPSACRSCGDASPVSFMVPRTTRAT